MDRLRAFSLIYLATPYSKFKDGLDAAFEAASALNCRLMIEGVNAYSPIVQTHPMAKYGNVDPRNHSIWLKFDEVMMERSDSLVVAMMDGWGDSFGISYEIDFFRKAEKPVFYINPQTLLVKE